MTRTRQEAICCLFVKKVGVVTASLYRESTCRNDQQISLKNLCLGIFVQGDSVHVWHCGIYKVYIQQESSWQLLEISQLVNPVKIIERKNMTIHHRVPDAPKQYILKLYLCVCIHLFIFFQYFLNQNNNFLARYYAVIENIPD